MQDQCFEDSNFLSNEKLVTNQAELPKLSLRDTIEDATLNFSSSVTQSGPLSSSLEPITGNVNDLHDVPINDDDNITPSLLKSSSIKEVK